MKKSLVVLVAGVLSSFAAQASDNSILSEYAPTGKVFSITSTCPQGAECIIQMYKVEMVFNLKGCADQLLSVTPNTVTDPATGKTTIYVSAVAAATKESTLAKCIAAPTATSSIEIGNPSADIEFVGQDPM